MIRAADLVQYAMNCRNPGGKQGGYIFGGHGQKCTRKVREGCAAANPSQAHRILGEGAKWDGHYVWDCSGVMRGAWRALATYRSGGATGIYREWCTRKGAIDTMPDEPGTLVCRGEGDTMQHIGVYVGDGMVVDARGTTEGVLYKPLKSFPWTHWCQPDDVDYAAQKPSEIIVTPALWTGTVKTRTGGGINIWADNTKRLSICRVPDGSEIDVLSDPDDKGFATCRHNGWTGAADTQYIYPPDGEDAQGAIYRARVDGLKTNKGLNLRSTPEKIANTIFFIPPGATVEVFEGAGAGDFAFVRYEGVTGYCTSSYLTRLAEKNL